MFDHYGRTFARPRCKYLDLTLLVMHYMILTRVATLFIPGQLDQHTIDAEKWRTLPNR
jgi:hypothetical protein